ncbi:MAG TPA: hypothetical protein VI229_03120 [Burkholderiales bacterium]
MGIRFGVARAFAAALLLSGCAALPPAPPPSPLEARIAAILERRGPGAGSLSLITEILGSRPLPPQIPPLVRELLARPGAAADAAAIFERAVPHALSRFAASGPEPVALAAPVDIRELLDPYLRDLAEAQRVLRGALGGGEIATELVLEGMRKDLPSSEWLAPLSHGVDAAELQRANDLFLVATLRFTNVLRTHAGNIRFPDRAERFESAIGTVQIGSAGEDEHGPEAAVIVDPGGNDRYRRAPATGGAVSVIFDLGGDDQYSGSDFALHGFSAIVDLAGNDQYRMQGPGVGAAVAGASLVLDFAGNDVYEADLFGIGAGALGLGAVVDFAGDDSYRVRAGGQGLGVTGGVGLLWDLAGDDRYVASGLPDAYDRGGGVSMAQGCGLGLRPRYGGGIGILRDDAGNDRYEAEMFAQGVAYWFGAGLLWDRAGNDTYSAVRYAQGNGVHLAVGTLRDDSGDDNYSLTVGVGQGMGLDLAVGVLYDAAGNDDYTGPNLVQGSATDNGIGILFDAGGTNRWRADLPEGGWGYAKPSRERPSIGLLLYEPAGALFERSGKVLQPPGDAPALGGPLGGRKP